MKRIGIYGGTFNPPHVGHIAAAKHAVDALRLDKLLVIPDRIAPHKQIPADSPSPRQRLEMLRIALGGEEKIEISDIELNRTGISYTCDTVEQIRGMYPDAEIFLMMGTDMFLSFHEWRNPEKILAQAALAVLYRGEKGEKQAILERKNQMEAQGHRVELVENRVVEISSTNLRRLLVFGCAEPFLPDGVGEYIRVHGLYGTAKDYRKLPMDELEKVVVGLLNPNRVAHVLGCRDTAARLAKRWGTDVTDAARAGLVHDITKVLDGPLQLTLCAGYGTILDDFSTNNPKTLHALTGSLVAEKVFGENEAVVSAICSHTTGKADMNLLEKIIYVADHMEPCRDFPGVEDLRYLADTDIDKALKLGLQMTLDLLKKQGREISPESGEALRWLNAQGI